MSSVRKIEAAIERLDVKQQMQLLQDRPGKLKILPEDLAALKNVDSAFAFWDSPDDATYHKP